MITDRRVFVVQLMAVFLASCGEVETPQSPNEPKLTAVGASSAAALSNFHRIYDDVKLRDAFFLFLQNVFRLYPEHKFHQLIIEQTATYASDADIYTALLKALPGIKPTGGDMTYSLPALKKQKDEMARQAASFLTDVKRIDGYIEVGTTGRYLASLSKKVPIEGAVFVLNEASPTYGPIDIIERGGLRKTGDFIAIGDYDPIPTSTVPDATIDLVSNLIGFHHCPVSRLDGFVTGIRRVLRPGGRLLLREHDVTDGQMNTFVALAHDVFNAGVGISWDDNQKQIRGFRSVDNWTAYVEAQGFRRTKQTQLQDHDPTDNAMLEFIKV
jgi:SAM-dependent methyltransferase